MKDKQNFKPFKNLGKIKSLSLSIVDKNMSIYDFYLFKISHLPVI